MALADRTTRDMVLLLTAYLSYRALRGCRDDLHLRLKSDEARRLAELERVFGILDPAAGDHPSFLLRLEERAPLRLAVEFRRDSGELAEGHLSNLSAGGFFVETAFPLHPGEHLTFKFLDLGAGRVWLFAGEVEWSREGAGGGMGLRFAGIPVEMRLGHIGRFDGPLPIAA